MDLTGFKKKNEKNNVFLKEMPHCIAQIADWTQWGRMEKEKHLLSQVLVVDDIGIEPITSCTSNRRSSQVS